ncbi:MAG: ice-binding family protein [Rhodohalobacter sp.]|nr:ice-binding family protein [Rhodohalobacter sp.]MDZ7755813.1 ice-binding family protein [Rhodohalobacter sp.]
MTALSVLLTGFMIGCDNSTSPDIDPEAPTIFSTSPVDGESDVERNKTVTVTFNQAMNAGTINNSTFTLEEDSELVSGTVEYSGTTARFTPDNVLNAQTNYTAKLSTEVKGTNGVSIAENTEWDFTTGGNSEALETVDLGFAGNYVILAKSAINNNPISDITGDLGISPAAGSFITGFALTDETGYATSSQVTGRVYAADMADPTPSNLTTAVENMGTAYTDAAGRTAPDFVELYTGNIGGRTLSPGLYTWSNTVTVPTSVTLSGGAEDVWIFQIAENLTVSSDVEITAERRSTSSKRLLAGSRRSYGWNKCSCGGRYIIYDGNYPHNRSVYKWANVGSDSCDFR